MLGPESSNNRAVMRQINANASRYVCLATGQPDATGEARLSQSCRKISSK
jgi:hypothetical protein